jgi:hypothetical protein
VSPVNPTRGSSRARRLALDRVQGSRIADKVSPCLPVYDVHWLSAYIATDGTRCVCVYEAPDAESVRRVYLRACGRRVPAPQQR